MTPVHRERKTGRMRGCAAEEFPILLLARGRKKTKFDFQGKKLDGKICGCAARKGPSVRPRSRPTLARQRPRDRGQEVSETDPKSQLETRRLQRSDVVARLTG